MVVLSRKHGSRLPRPRPLTPRAAADIAEVYDDALHSGVLQKVSGPDIDSMPCPVFVLHAQVSPVAASGNLRHTAQPMGCLAHVVGMDEPENVFTDQVSHLIAQRSGSGRILV